MECVNFNYFYEKYPFLKNEAHLANPNFFDLDPDYFFSFLDKFKKHIDEDQINEDIFEELLKDHILPKKPSTEQTKTFHTISLLLTLYEYSYEQTRTKKYRYYSSWTGYLMYSYIIRLFIYHENPMCFNENFVKSNRTNIQTLLSQPSGLSPSLKIKILRLLRYGLRIIHL